MTLDRNDKDRFSDGFARSLIPVWVFMVHYGRCQPPLGWAFCPGKNRRIIRAAHAFSERHFQRRVPRLNVGRKKGRR